MSSLVLILEIAGRRTAIAASEVHSVVELEAVCPVPRAPAHVLGLTALRSSTLTVVDAAVCVGLPGHGRAEERARSAIVDHAGHRYALVVDRIDDVAQVLSDPTPVPGDVGQDWARVSHGLIETDRGPALLLSLEQLLAVPSAIAA